MSRKLHLVGAWPGRNPDHAMELCLDQLAPYLRRMSDGETGDRHQWITVPGDALRSNPDLEMTKDGGWTDYTDISAFRVRDGVTMDPDNVRLPLARAFEGSFPAFKVLRERYGRGDLAFQVGIPAPLDLAIYFLGDATFTDPSIMEALTRAHIREIERIHAQGADEVVFQIETVVGLVAVAQAPDDQQPDVAAQMAGTFKDLVARSPEGARFGIHLCLGDFHHKAYGAMRDVRPLVLLANEFARDFPAGRSLDFVHAPFAAAAKPPIPEESFYAPLQDLQLPDDVRFIAGFIHESLDLPAHQRLLERIERFAGREVDVSQACGLGRRDTVEECWEAMREGVRLIESATAV